MATSATGTPGTAVPQCPEDWARELRRACKSKFFKQVTEQSIRDVFDAASAAGVEPRQFINLGNENTKTALMFTAQLNRSAGVVRVLLEHGADINQSTNRGHTPIFYSASKGRDEVTLLLLEHGAKCRVYNVNGVTPLIAGEAKLAPSTLEAIRQKESEETDEYIDFRNDPVAVEAQLRHRETCRGCQRVALKEAQEEARLNGQDDAEVTALLFSRGRGKDNVPVECAPATRSRSFVEHLSPARLSERVVALLDEAAPELCGQADPWVGELPTMVTSEISRAMSAVCSFAYSAGGEKRKELNHQFRASVRDLCQRYLAEETCPVGGILLLKATTRTNLDAHLEPMGVRGRKAANVHAMVGGALCAALVGQAEWMCMVGLPRLLSCVDSDVFLNIVSTVALRTEQVSFSCDCMAAIENPAHTEMWQQGLQSAQNGKCVLGAKLLYIFSPNPVSKEWAEALAMAVESSIQCCQFEALDVLLGDSLPPQLLPLRRSAVSSLLDFVEEQESVKGAHAHLRSAIRFAGQWGLAAGKLSQDDRSFKERLEKAILREMLSRGDTARAWLYAEDVPHLQELLAGHVVVAEESALARPAEGYMDFPMGMEAIVWTDSVEGLKTIRCEILCCVSAAAGDSTVSIGIDTEWRDPRPHCAIIQLALPHVVYLVDTYLPLASDEHDIYAGELSSMLEWLFTLPAIHGQGAAARVEVLGFGFHGDVGHLVKLGVGAEAMMNVKDLQKPCQELLGIPHLPSLTHVAKSLLGRPLDKTQQCSNWERRPLSSAQSHYAALDAHVLLSIAQCIDNGGGRIK